MSNPRRVGVLTGGGDAPGLNPAIKGMVYRGSELGLQVIGLFDGWRSLLNSFAGSAAARPRNRALVERYYDTQRYHLRNIGM